MASNTGFGVVEFWDDFLKDISHYVETVTGGATGVDIFDRHGGWIRMDVDGDDADAVTLGAELAWEADEGSSLIFETRLRGVDVSDIALFVGMSDANNDATVITDENGTLAAVADDAWGFLLDGETTERWQAVSVRNTVLTTQVDLSLGAVAADNVVQTLKMESDPASSGTARYFIDGEIVNTSTTWYRSSILYTPILNIDDRNQTNQMDVDYWYVRAPREN